MNILLIGAGGREHAFAYKLSQSTLCTQLFIALGNAGTAEFGKNIKMNPNDFETLGQFCIENTIELLIVGPEEPLVLGMRDYFEANENLKNILFIGPDKMGATMEASKDWSKAFMYKNNIPEDEMHKFLSYGRCVIFESFHNELNDYVFDYYFIKEGYYSIVMVMVIIIMLVVVKLINLKLLVLLKKKMI